MNAKKFTVGDPVPTFYCRSTNNDNFSFASTAGRYLVLSFFGSATNENSAAILKYITKDARRAFDDDKTAFFGISTDAEDESSGRVAQVVPGLRYFWDFDKKVSTLYGAVAEDGSHQGFTLVLDPNLRVLGAMPHENVAQHNERLGKLLTSLPPIDDYAQVPIYAPVLIVPRVLEPSFCRELIALYETNGGKESGSMIEKNGRTVPRINHNFKKRMDYEIAEKEIRAGIRSRVERRIFPEIEKAFQNRMRFIERYIVACYDAESGGFFKPHRDDTTKATAHRQFACTINLNADEYDGGDLRFPEFGTQSYRAPTGGAVVFSCSLLHEATPVTRGKRYATLPFLYDEKGAELRKANEAFLDMDTVYNENKPATNTP